MSRRVYVKAQLDLTCVFPLDDRDLESYDFDGELNTKIEELLEDWFTKTAEVDDVFQICNSLEVDRIEQDMPDGAKIITDWVYE